MPLPTSTTCRASRASLRLPAQLHQPRGPNRPRPDRHQTTEALPGQVSLVPHADREAGRGRDLLCPVGHPRRILDVGRSVDHDPSGQGGAGMLLPCRDGPLADCDVADRQAHARGRGRWRRARPRGGGRAQEETLGERPDRRRVEPAGGQDEDLVGPAHPTGGGSRRRGEPPRGYRSPGPAPAPRPARHAPGRSRWPPIVRPRHACGSAGGGGRRPTARGARRPTRRPTRVGPDRARAGRR